MIRKTFNLLVLGIVSSSTFAFSQIPRDLAPEVLAYADRVFYNGNVLTADEKFTVAPAVAIRDGKILAIGEDSRILRMAGPKTVKINLKGNSLIPGFYSVHADGNFKGNHGAGGPFGTVPIPFPDMQTGLTNIRKLVEAAEDGEWVYVDVPITDLTYKYLDRHILDTVAPNHPLQAADSCAQQTSRWPHTARLDSGRTIICLPKPRTSHQSSSTIPNNQKHRRNCR